jgi:hypothetical protein
VLQLEIALHKVKNLILWWLDSEVRMLYLAQGEYKNTWWVPKPRRPTRKKPCASVIVRDATAASTTSETSAWTLKSSPNFPLPRDAQT